MKAREQCVQKLLSFFHLENTGDMLDPSTMAVHDLEENAEPPLPLVIKRSHIAPSMKDRVIFVRRLEREIFMQADDKDSFIALVSNDKKLLMHVVASGSKPDICYVKNMRNLAEDTPSE